MNDHHALIHVDATPDDILAMFRDMYRHDPDADPRISLSHDSTIDEWREACELLPWAKVAEAMNSHWSVAIPMEHWRDVLEPPKKRRLGDVCKLLARHVKLPRVRPTVILGSRCVSGSAFLAIRTMLADAGADVTDIAPSTPLHEFTRRYPKVFLGPISQLSPGALPRAKIRTPVHDSVALVMGVAWLAMMIGLFTGKNELAWWGGLTIVCCTGFLWTIGREILPASVEFHGLQTFRDLSKAIAKPTI